MTLRHAASLAALALALTAAPAMAAPKADPAKTVGKIVAWPSRPPSPSWTPTTTARSPTSST